MTEELLRRVAGLERRLRGLEAELAEVRALARAAAPKAPAQPEPSPAPPPPWLLPARTPPPPRTPPPLRAPRFVLPEIEVEDLFGASTLAWSGGVVTLLGVVFFFVLAVNRGWIGPGTRVGLGAAASLLVFAAGLWSERRYGAYHSARAAVGAGIAGGYATLLAATALYDLLPDWGALLAAAGIASVGLAVSLAWSAELVAGLGLVGAMAVPALLVLDGGLTTVGTAFVAVVFAAAAVVAAREGWRKLLVVSLLVSLVQVAALVLDTFELGVPWVRLALAGVFWLLYLGAGLAWQLRRYGGGLEKLTVGLLLVSASFAAYAASLLLDGRWWRLDREGVVLAGAAVVYGVLCAALFRRPGSRQLAVLLGALGLAVGAIAAADLVSGASLTYVWAAEAALLAWLAWRLDELRFQLVSLAYLGLATWHALAYEGRLEHLFEPNRHPGGAAPSALALLAAAAVGAAYARRREGEAPADEGALAFLAPLLTGLRGAEAEMRTGLVTFASLAGLYALALGILELFELGAGDVEAWFERGHVVVTAAWALVGLAAVVAGLRRAQPALAAGGLGWLGATLAKTLLYDAAELDPDQRSYAFLAVGACVLLAAFLFQLLRDARAPLGPVAVGGSIVGAGLGVVAVSTLLDGDRRGLALLGVAAAYGALAAVAFRRHRDLSTLLWTIALAVAAGADAVLVGRSWLTLAWAGSAAGLAGLALVLDERRLQLAALGYLGLAGAWTLGAQAPPADLLRAGAHPGAGLPSLVYLVAATAVFARLCDIGAAWRRWAGWAAGVLAVYALSLGILELAEWIGSADVTTLFQRGHTGVSALWGVLGLALLYVGLTRRLPGVRLGGFALFGVSLAKLFLYDLAFLSSVTRALSFLAVGAVLLLGGFFYQRLSAGLEERPAGY